MTSRSSRRSSLGRAAGAAALLLVALGLASCAPSSPDEVGDDVVIIDVRTPSEWAEGHLEGAVLIDLNGGEFESRIDALSRDDDYLVYCRSGNRSAQAAAAMRGLGFTEVIDGGGISDASRMTGRSIVVD